LEYLVAVVIIIALALDIGALAAVIHEDILYSKKEKLFKIIFILCIPIIGALRELLLLRKYGKDYHRVTEDPNAVTPPWS